MQTAHGEGPVNRFSDRGSIPLGSTKNGKSSEMPTNRAFQGFSLCFIEGLGVPICKKSFDFVYNK